MKRAAVQMKSGAAGIERFEEGKSHQMIPVGVGENKIYVVYIFFGEFVAKSADSGAGIHRNDIIVFGSDFQTGGIAAVFQIPFARNRNRAPRSPACDFHRKPFNGN